MTIKIIKSDINIKRNFNGQTCPKLRGKWLRGNHGKLENKLFYFFLSFYKFLVEFVFWVREPLIVSSGKWQREEEKKKKKLKTDPLLQLQRQSRLAIEKERWTNTLGRWWTWRPSLRALSRRKAFSPRSGSVFIFPPQIPLTLFFYFFLFFSAFPFQASPPHTSHSHHSLKDLNITAISEVTNPLSLFSFTPKLLESKFHGNGIG